MRNALLLAALAVVLIVSNASWAEDWPQWRGPNRDGQWNAEGIVDTLPDGQLPLEWKFDIGPGYSGPTVAKGRVFVMDRQVDGSRQTERVLCVNSSTGQLLWQHAYPALYTISYKAGPRASVTVDGPLAYAVGAMGHMHCLNVDDGKVLWSRSLAEEFQVDLPIWGIAGSPLIYGDMVIQQVGGPGACYVAFDKQTGREVWRSLDERAGYSSPIVIEQGGQDVLIAWTGESLSGLDPKTGEVFWAHPMPPLKMPIGIATPTVADNQIFVSSFYDGSLMIEVSKDSPESQLVWRARGKDERHTGSATVTLKDQVVREGGPYGVHTMIGNPILKDGLIFAVDSYGEFRCLDALTGKRLWEDQSAVPFNRWATIHMVRHGDRTWMFNEDGELLIAQLSRDGLTIESRCQLIAPTLDQLPRREGVCWSHPAFAEKSIFARNDNQLVKASLAK